MPRWSLTSWGLNTPKQGSFVSCHRGAWNLWFHVRNEYSSYNWRGETQKKKKKHDFPFMVFELFPQQLSLSKLLNLSRFYFWNKNTILSQSFSLLILTQLTQLESAQSTCALNPGWVGGKPWHRLNEGIAGGIMWKTWEAIGRWAARPFWLLCSSVMIGGCDGVRHTPDSSSDPVDAETARVRRVFSKQQWTKLLWKRKEKVDITSHLKTMLWLLLLFK